MDEFEKKMFKQFRVIRNYAHSKHISFELACDLWCENGLDEIWAKQNKLIGE